MRLHTVILGLVVLAGTLAATTLEKLSMDEMIAKSTAIVRGKVVDSRGARRGGVIYTYYRVQVSESLKGDVSGQVEVLAPGGLAGGLRQTIPGAPKLAAGGEYVLFLWQGPSGANHLLGLSQGVFDVKTSAGGVATLYRGALEARVVDAQGRDADAPRMAMSWSELTAQVKKSLRAVTK